MPLDSLMILVDFVYIFSIVVIVIDCITERKMSTRACVCVYVCVANNKWKYLLYRNW